MKNISLLVGMLLLQSCFGGARVSCITPNVDSRGLVGEFFLSEASKGILAEEGYISDGMKISIRGDGSFSFNNIPNTMFSMAGRPKRSAAESNPLYEAVNDSTYLDIEGKWEIEDYFAPDLKLALSIETINDRFFGGSVLDVGTYICWNSGKSALKVPIGFNYYIEFIGNAIPNT